MTSNSLYTLTISGPQLVMVTEPESKHRFRYESEGGSHGVLVGKDNQKGKKTFPTVKLINYNGPSHNIYIRVSLWTEEGKEHDVMFFKEKRSSKHKMFIDEDLNNDYTAVCKNLKVLSKKKEEVYSLLLNRRIKSSGRKLSLAAKEKFEEENTDDIKKEAKEISNSLVLHFDAFEKGRPGVQICPTLNSDPICNQKAASKGDLKIHRMSKVSGSWNGDDDVILLCDKIQKDKVKILFYETDGEWMAYAAFNPADVHYQVAIPFKTPKYKMNAEKTVAVCLERNGERSEPRYFTYIPEDCPSKKRKKCVPEQTVNLLSPMDISSPNSSTSAVSDDSSQETRNLLQTLHEMLTEPECASSEQTTEKPSDILNPGMLENMHLSGILPDLLWEKLSADLEANNENYDELLPYDSNDNSQFFLNTSRSFEMDCGKLEGQMAVLNIGDSDSSLTSKSAPTKESKINKMSENQEKQLEKITHIFLKRDSFGNTLLHLAVLHNKNIEVAIYLFHLIKPDIINCQNFNKQTALHIAVEKDNGVVKSLLSIGGNPNIKNSEGNNCYHIAAENNLCERMLDLLRYSQFPHNLNEFNYDGLTPFHLAVKKNSVACFYLLKKHHMVHFSFSEQKCGRSLLHYAVEFQPSFVFHILQQEETDVNIQDIEGNTPLHIACGLGNYDTVKQLLLTGADPTIKNFKQSFLSLEEECSDDEAADGETPADLTTDQRILELLKQALKRGISDVDTSTDNAKSTGTSEALVESLCNVLDPLMRWKDVAIYILDEKFINSLECSESPTKALLDYMKRTSGDGYFEEFKTALQMAGLNDAVQIITENNNPLIVL